MTADAVLLRQLISFNEPAAPIAIPVLLLLYWAYPATVVLVLALSVTPTIVIQRYAVHYANNNRIREGVNALALAIWVPTFAMAILAPALWALVCVFCLLSVVLALPFVDSMHLLKLTIVASTILVVGAIATMFDPLLSFEEVPEQLTAAVAGVGAMAGAILSMFSVRQSNGRLRDTLAATQRANQALRESEQSLERKVGERTIELGEARDAALDASRAKSDFLANMSHELRTPLNAIIGYGEMLQEEVTDNAHDDYRPDLDRIVTSGRQLLGLINDVLDLSKIEAGKMEINLEDFDIGSFLEDIEGTFAPLAAKRDNRPDFRFDPTIGSMRSDVTKVRQGLLNILSNAAKFTANGVISLTVERQTLDGGSGEVVFRISDTGIGMTADQIEKVFESFNQAEETTARDYGGTGLGLAITKQFCEMLDGSISCISEPGAGSTFEIRLPDLDAIAAQSPQSVASEGPTVLVVDDDPNALDLLERFLSRNGFNVLTEASGDAALRTARAKRPDVITLDVVMPGMDGLEVLRLLKNEPQLEHIPVILLTVTEDQKLGYALGASEYLTKPVDWQRLSTALQRLQVAQHGTVLVVDDDPAARDIVGRGLRRDGWTVVEAEHGRSAILKVEESVPSLILLDLMMPEMDGFEFITALHEQPDWREIPIIVITSMDVTDAERARLAGGVRQIVAKSNYAMSDLLLEVRRAAQLGTSEGNQRKSTGMG